LANPDAIFCLPQRPFSPADLVRAVEALIDAIIGTCLLKDWALVSTRPGVQRSEWT